MAEGPLHDTIEKYLLGELSAPECRRLEALMATDPTLWEQVELQRLGLTGMERLAAADLRGQFDLWDKDLDEPRPPTASPPPRAAQNFWIWATATLILLLLAGTFWHFWQVGKVPQSQNSETHKIAQRDSLISAMRLTFELKQDSLTALMALPKEGKDSVIVLEIKRLREALDLNERKLRDLESRRRAGKPLIAMQFAPPSNTSTRGGEEGSDSTLVAEKKAFDAKDFAESIRLLKSIPAKDSRQAEVTQRLPYSLFYAKDFEAAIPAFLDLLEKDQYEEANAQWHLLLCYVATGQALETRLMLHVILNGKNPKYHQKASDLKKTLNIR